jgi:hypothetical protein
VTTRSSAAAIKDGDEGDHKRQNRNKMVSSHHRRSPPVNIVPLIVLSCARATGVAISVLYPTLNFRQFLRSHGLEHVPLKIVAHGDDQSSWQI